MKKAYYAIALLVAAVLLTTMTTASFTDSNHKWTYLTDGSMTAEKVGETWYLRPVETVYLNMLGMEGKQSNVLSTEVSKIDPKKLVLKKTTDTRLIENPPYLIAITDPDQVVFDIRNHHSIRLSDGSIIVDDHELLALKRVTAQGEVAEVLSKDGYEQTSRSIKTLAEKGEQTGLLEWGTLPFVTENNALLFHSNRHTAGDGNFSLSVYYMENIEQQSKPRLLLDFVKYNSPVIVLAATDQRVVAYLSRKNAVLTYNMQTGVEEIFEIHASPISASPEGKVVLYREVHDGVVQRDLKWFHTDSGEITTIHMPEDYFFNTDGAWSPDGEQYAFNLNGFQNEDADDKWYRTNIKIAVVHVSENSMSVFDKPSEDSNLYQLGQLSWIENHTIVAYTDDNKTWALTMKQ